MIQKNKNSHSIIITEVLEYLCIIGLKIEISISQF
jgi:hypothetical protein